MWLFSPGSPRQIAIGILLVRVITGVVFIAHGAQKLFTMGLAGVVGGFTQMGVQLLRVLGISGLFVNLALVHTGGLQGTGDTRGPLYITLLSQIGVPIGLCFLFQALHGQLRPGEIWLAIVLGHFTRATLSFARFRRGKWRQIAVDIEPARA